MISWMTANNGLAYAFTQITERSEEAFESTYIDNKNGERAGTTRVVATNSIVFGLTANSHYTNETTFESGKTVMFEDGIPIETQSLNVNDSSSIESKTSSYNITTSVIINSIADIYTTQTSVGNSTFFTTTNVFNETYSGQTITTYFDTIETTYNVPTNKIIDVYSTVELQQTSSHVGVWDTIHQVQVNWAKFADLSNQSEHILYLTEKFKLSNWNGEAIDALPHLKTASRITVKAELSNTSVSTIVGELQTAQNYYEFEHKISSDQFNEVQYSESSSVDFGVFPNTTYLVQKNNYGDYVSFVKATPANLDRTITESVNHVGNTKTYKKYFSVETTYADILTNKEIFSNTTYSFLTNVGFTTQPYVNFQKNIDTAITETVDDGEYQNEGLPEGPITYRGYSSSVFTGFGNTTIQIDPEENLGFIATGFDRPNKQEYNIPRCSVFGKYGAVVNGSSGESFVCQIGKTFETAIGALVSRQIETNQFWKGNNTNVTYETNYWTRPRNWYGRGLRSLVDTIVPSSFTISNNSIFFGTVSGTSFVASNLPISVSGSIKTGLIAIKTVFGGEKPENETWVQWAQLGLYKINNENNTIIMDGKTFIPEGTATSFLRATPYLSYPNNGTVTTIARNPIPDGAGEWAFGENGFGPLS